MLESLKSRTITRLPDQVTFRGRVLFLAEDAGLIREQLAGKDLPWPPPFKLRDDISTDEITPAYICYYYDERLGEFPYLGLKAGSEVPDRARGGQGRRIRGGGERQAAGQGLEP